MRLPRAHRIAVEFRDGLTAQAHERVVRCQRAHCRESLLGPNTIESFQTAVELEGCRHREAVSVAGLVICRQKPPTAKGFCFLTLEDETGLINVLIEPETYERERRLVRLAPLIVVLGKLERSESVINVRAERFFELSDRALQVKFDSHDYH